MTATPPNQDPGAVSELPRLILVGPPRPTDCPLCGADTMSVAEHVVSARAYTGDLKTRWFCNWSCLAEYARRRTTPEPRT